MSGVLPVAALVVIALVISGILTVLGRMLFRFPPFKARGDEFWVILVLVSGALVVAVALQMAKAVGEGP